MLFFAQAVQEVAANTANASGSFKLSFVDTGVILVYLLAMAAMGIYFSKKNTGTEEYFVGGRSFGGWIIGLSLVGTSISSITFLSFPADAYKTAWLRYIPSLTLPIAIVIAILFFLPFFRRANITSAYEYLEDRFGPSIRSYGAFAFIVGQLFRVSIILYLVSLLINEMTGLAPWVCILIGGIFVAFYTIVGGIDAVIWTDVIQTLVLVAGGLICIGVIFWNVDGGMAEVFSTAWNDGKFAMADLEKVDVNGVTKEVMVQKDWGFSLTDKTVFMLLLTGLFAWLSEYATNQNIVQRYCASKNEKEARKAMIVCVASSLPIWAFFMFIGTALYVFFKHNGDPYAAAILTGEGGLKAENILPYFIMEYLPVGISGIVIAAAAAAAMSSLDSSINAISTVVVTDFYKRYFVKNREDKHYLKAAWIIATIAGLFMIFGAIILASVESKTLQDTAAIIASLLAAGLFGLFAIGFFTRAGDARAIWIGILFTVIFTGWTIVAKNPPENLDEQNKFIQMIYAVPFDLYYTGMLGNIIMFILGFIVGSVLGTKKDLTNLTVWDLERGADQEAVAVTASEKVNN
ncbi:sodium:solute symporter [Poriferisphaera sp. WC338]|uniref:sodium:solute symporter n=1 Tax=Poriferisphaera sp. WC338 TaxID=3425129 RepID=UPI003D813717